MTFLEVFEKYNLTEKEVHSLQVMKHREQVLTWLESKIYFTKFNLMRKDGILIDECYSENGLIRCKVADFIYE